MFGSFAVAIAAYLCMAGPSHVKAYWFKTSSRSANRIGVGSVLLTSLVVSVLCNRSLSGDHFLERGYFIIFISYGIQFLVVAACEEYAFRGVLLSLLSSRLNVVLSVLIAASVFGLFHVGELAYFALAQHHGVLSLGSIATAIAEDLVPFGIVMGYLYLRTKQLLWPVLLHWLNDWSPWGQYVNSLWNGWLTTVALYVVAVILAEFVHAMQEKGSRATVSHEVAS